METQNIDDIILALLFASDEPLSVKRIASVFDEVSAQEIRATLDRLGTSFGDRGSVIRLEQVAGGYQLSTNPEYAEYVARLYRGRRKQRLSKASMETLAIIAYKQPITRADIENIRGVGCGGVVTTLMERGLIRIVGKARVLGSPFLYGTTQEFLEYLGLNSLKDLPSIEDLEALLQEEAETESTEEPEAREAEEPELEETEAGARDVEGRGDEEPEPESETLEAEGAGRGAPERDDADFEDRETGERTPEERGWEERAQEERGSEERTPEEPGPEERDTGDEEPVDEEDIRR